VTDRVHLEIPVHFEQDKQENNLHFYKSSRIIFCYSINTGIDYQAINITIYARFSGIWERIIMPERQAFANDPCRERLADAEPVHSRINGDSNRHNQICRRENHIPVSIQMEDFE
jgi:hypothetical protein